MRLVLGAAGIEAIAGMLVAAVGPATAAALEAEGRTPDLVATTTMRQGLLPRCSPVVWPARRSGFRWPKARAERSRTRSVPRGAAVTEQYIYKSAMPVSAPERLRAAFDGGVDAITLTSGSTARHLVEAVGVAGVPAGASIVCIGEQTAVEARAAGPRRSPQSPRAPRSTGCSMR